MLKVKLAPSAIMRHLVEQVLVFGAPAAIAIVLTLRLRTRTDALWWSALGTAFAFLVATMFTDPRGPFDMMALAIAAPVVVLYAVVVVLLTDAARTIVRRFTSRNRGDTDRGVDPPSR